VTKNIEPWLRASFLRQKSVPYISKPGHVTEKTEAIAMSKEMPVVNKVLEKKRIIRKRRAEE
jgi:hypothetical protein